MTQYAIQDTDIAQAIIRKAANTNEYLNLLTDKRPTKDLNDVLLSFLKIVYPFYSDCVIHTVLNDELMRKNLLSLRRQLSECEFEQEIFWAQQIAEGKAHYTDYPDMPCYRALLASEHVHLCKIMQPNHHAFCFIGSGPMPISAFEFKKAYPNVSMHGIEMDEDAIRLGEKVSARSGVDVYYTKSMAQDADFSAYDVIFVASMTMQKKDVLEQISRTAKSGTLIAVRSVEHLRHMLYEPVAAEMIPDTFASLGKTPYSDQHVNTTLFYRLQK